MLLQHKDQAQQRRDRKRHRQQPHHLIRPGQSYHTIHQPKSPQTRRRRGDPWQLPCGKELLKHQRKRREERVEAYIPQQRCGGVFRVETLPMPRPLQRQHTAQRRRHQHRDPADVRKPQQKHREQQRETKHRRRINHVQMQRGENQQRKRQHRRADRQHRRQRHLRHLAREETAGHPKQHREAAQHDEEHPQAACRIRGQSKQPRPCRDERQRQCGEHGDQRTRENRQPYDEQIHQQDRRPQHQAHCIQTQHRHEQQHQRDHRRPAHEQRGGLAAALPQHGEGRVQQAKAEINAQRIRQ